MPLTRWRLRMAFLDPRKIQAIFGLATKALTAISTFLAAVYAGYKWLTPVLKDLLGPSVPSWVATSLATLVPGIWPRSEAQGRRFDIPHSCQFLRRRLGRRTRGKNLRGVLGSLNGGRSKENWDCGAPGGRVRRRCHHSGGAWADRSQARPRAGAHFRSIR